MTRPLCQGEESDPATRLPGP